MRYMPWKNGPPKIPCPLCGEPMYRRGEMCRDCYRARVPQKTCVDCGKVLPDKKATLCRTCWMRHHTESTSRPTCVDCGKPCSWQVGRKGTTAKRCWDCEVKRRHANRVIVNLPGRIDSRTTNPEGRSFRQQRKRAGTLRALLGPLPCAICGYNRLRSRIHRIIAANGYVWGNVVQVCSNCHYEIHDGVTPCPPAAAIPATV